MDVSTSTGAVKTTFYNLNVLNQLAMACIDNEKLNDDLSNKQVPIVGGLSYRPATRNERNHAHSKPSDL